MANSAPPRVHITHVEMTAASATHAAAGLLGWVNFTVNAMFIVDAVALRRTRDGQLTLSYPARQSHRGRWHFAFRPANDAARREIEAQVLAALGIEQGDSR